MMNPVNVTVGRNPLSKDITYWVVFVLAWALLWGLSDQQYLRNVFIQLFSLPARMLLVYITVGYLYPRYFKQEKYRLFFLLYLLLLLAITLIVQRPVILYVVQPRFLPFWNDPYFFSTSAIINTALDVNIAAVVPLGYQLIRLYKQRPANQAIGTQIIELRVDKTQHRVAAGDIICVESQRNTVRIILEGKELIVRESMSALAEKLGHAHFLRVHRSFLVNTEKVTAVSPVRILCGALVVPVGRKYKEAVKACAALHSQAAP